MLPTIRSRLPLPDASAFQVSRSRGGRCACVNRRNLRSPERQSVLASHNLSGVASGHAGARRNSPRHLHSTQPVRKYQSGIQYPYIRTASAANANGSLETVLSKVRRARTPICTPAILARGLPIRSIVYRDQSSSASVGFGSVVSRSQMRAPGGTHFSGRTHFHGTWAPPPKSESSASKIFRDSGISQVFETAFEILTRVGPDNSLERLTECSVGLVTDQPSDVYELFVTLFQ